MALNIILLISVVGFLLSVYAFFIEKKSKESKNYKAVCDISEGVSCTKAFRSEYGKILGVSNSFFGMIFYVAVFILAYLNYLNYVFYLSVVAIIGSIYLAYILYFKLKNLCLVCTGIYLVNILLLIFSYVGSKIIV